MRDLGFEEGLMVEHLKGHDEAAKIIRKIFARGWESWPIGRSIFYALKRFDLASEGSYHTAEVELRGWEIYFST